MGRGGRAKVRSHNDRIRKKRARDKRVREEKGAQRQQAAAERTQ
jgi:hypothetical protein